MTAQATSGHPTRRATVQQQDAQATSTANQPTPQARVTHKRSGLRQGGATHPGTDPHAHAPTGALGEGPRWRVNQ
jgi:hypothetical protein